MLTTVIFPIMHTCLVTPLEFAGRKYQEYTGNDLSKLSLGQRVWVITSIAISIIASVTAIITNQWMLLGVSALLFADVNDRVSTMSQIAVLNTVVSDRVQARKDETTRSGLLDKMQEQLASYQVLYTTYNTVATQLKQTCEELRAVPLVEDNPTAKRFLESVDKGAELIAGFEQQLNAIKANVEKESVFKAEFEVALRQFTESVSKVDMGTMISLQRELASTLRELNTTHAQVTILHTTFSTVNAELTTLREEQSRMLKEQGASVEKIQALKAQEEVLLKRNEALTANLEAISARKEALASQQEAITRDLSKVKDELQGISADLTKRTSGILEQVWAKLIEQFRDVGEDTRAAEDLKAKFLEQFNRQFPFPPGVLVTAY